MSRILVVEDSAAIRLLIRRRLTLAGHSVEEAANGLEALENLDENEPPDLLVMDETMPVMDGPTLLARLGGRLPELPVIVVSARREAESDATTEGVDVRLEKPIDFDRLLDAIHRLTGGYAGERGNSA